MFWFFGCEACRILALRPGIKPTSLALEREVLTTGPPGKSLQWIFNSWKIGRTTVVLINCFNNWSIVISSVQFSLSVMSDSLRPPWTAAGPASLSITNSWSPPKSTSIVSVMPSNHLILYRPLLLLPSIFPASGSFQMSQLSTSAGQSIGVSASTSVSPMNTQDWFPLGWTGWISLQSIIVKKKS